MKWDTWFNFALVNNSVELGVALRFFGLDVALYLVHHPKGWQLLAADIAPLAATCYVQVCFLSVFVGRRSWLYG